jgi:hypothetical protein
LGGGRTGKSTSSDEPCASRMDALGSPGSGRDRVAASRRRPATRPRPLRAPGSPAADRCRPRGSSKRDPVVTGTGSPITSPFTGSSRSFWTFCVSWTALYDSNLPSEEIDRWVAKAAGVVIGSGSPARPTGGLVDGDAPDVHAAAAIAHEVQVPAVRSPDRIPVQECILRHGHGVAPRRRECLGSRSCQAECQRSAPSVAPEQSRT